MPEKPDESELPPSERRHTRFAIPETLLIEMLDENGDVAASEVTVTENVSLGGAAVFTSFAVEPGTFVRVKSERHDLSIISIVRGKRAGEDEYHVRRKPQHVQRAVWQPVHYSDFMPIRTDYLRNRYEGSPWVGDEHWNTDGRSYSCDTAAATMLIWDYSRRHIDDWNPYNTFGPQNKLMPVSDVRIAASIVPQQPGLKTTLELQTRSHVFEFTLNATSADTATATMRMRPQGDGDWTVDDEPITLPGP